MFDFDNLFGWFIVVYVVVAIFLVLIGIPAGIYYGSTQEAKQFNRFSRTKITWWDALWTDFRILPDK